MPLYVLDTNIFIQAHRDTYPLDVAASFWDAIKLLAQEEKIISIDKVKAEIDRNEDELKEWIEAQLPEDFFKSTEEQDILDNYGLMATIHSLFTMFCQYLKKIPYFLHIKH